MEVELASRVVEARRSSTSRTALVDGVPIRMDTVGLHGVVKQISSVEGLRFSVGGRSGWVRRSSGAGPWGAIAMTDRIDLYKSFGGLALVHSELGAKALVRRMRLHADGSPSTDHIVAYCVVVAYALDWVASTSVKLLGQVALQGSPPRELRPWFQSRQ